MTSSAKSRRMAAAEPTAPEPGTGELARLRQRAVNDSAGAREECWAWLADMDTRLRRDRAGTSALLAATFRAGGSAAHIDGAAQGMPVGWVNAIAARTVGVAVASTWIGKRFYAAAGKGDNVFLAKRSWPSLSGTRLTGLAFKISPTRGLLDPDVDVVHIDYLGVRTSWVRRLFHDEIVELVPGVYLGKAIWRGPAGKSRTLAAYFAMRTERP
jgi:hypothetical protein